MVPERSFARPVGIFIVVALVISLAAMIGIGLRHGWLVPKDPIYAIFEHTAFVQPGDPVTLAGFTVGDVHDIVLLPDFRLFVDMRVEQKYFSYLNTGTIAVQEPALLIGSGKIRLQPGQSGVNLEPGDTLESVSFDFELPMALAAVDISNNVTNAISNMRMTTENVAALSSSLAHPDSSLGRMMRAMADLMEAYAYGDGLVRALATESGIRTEVDSTLVATRELMDRMNNLLVDTDRLITTSESLLVQTSLSTRAVSEQAGQLTEDIRPLLLELRQLIEMTRRSWPLTPREQ